jgi:hypothetical protein
MSKLIYSCKRSQVQLCEDLLEEIGDSTRAVADGLKHASASSVTPISERGMPKEVFYFVVDKIAANVISAALTKEFGSGRKHERS